MTSVSAEIYFIETSIDIKAKTNVIALAGGNLWSKPKST
jgi:hypothetical protein